MEDTLRLWLNSAGTKLLVGVGNAPIYGKRELLQECCCEGEEAGCPEDCSKCPGTVLLTVSGVVGDHCTVFNKAWTLTYQKACLWLGGGVSGGEAVQMHMYCKSAKWYIDIANQSFPATIRFQVAAAGCFPRSGWLRTSGTCTGGKASLAW